jgi:hypothetical protein
MFRCKGGLGQRDGQREDERLLAELRKVLPAAPPVGWFHFNAE